VYLSVAALDLHSPPIPGRVSINCAGTIMSTEMRTETGYVYDDGARPMAERQALKVLIRP
jgi:hypothetical protein